MWILLFGALITRGSYYMVWPFLAVILYKKFGISATQVGMILTSAALVSVLAGFVGGALSDHFGRKKVMYTSGFLYIVSFSLLANADSIIGYSVVIALCSIATEIWRPSTTALIGDIIKDKKTRELAMQALYFMVNVGSAIGPMIGLWLGLAGESSTFYVTAATFAIFLIVLKWGFNAQKINDANLESDVSANLSETQPNQDSAQSPDKAKTSDKLVQTLRILVQDRLLQCLILANILCMFIYGQMDSTLIQYLTRAEVPDLLALISSMIFTNALVIITSQFVLLKLMARIDLVHRIQMGLVLLTASQVWMAVNPVDLFWGWIGAVVVMSLAEAILFPTMNVHIDRLAPDHLRGAYFGATAFYSLGFALAPLGGGLMLDYIGGFWLYLVSAFLCLVVFYLYSVLESFKRPADFLA